VDGSAREMGEKFPVFFREPGEGSKVLMIAFYEIDRPDKTSALLYKVFMQIGFINPEVSQMNDAGDRTVQDRLGIFDLLIDGIVITVRIRGYQYQLNTAHLSGKVIAQSRLKIFCLSKYLF
jgi:hypothetical protein